MDQFTQTLTDFVLSVITVLTLVLPAIGLTGGIKGIFDSAPDLKIGPWTIRDGVWLSFLCSLALVVGANVLGLAPEVSSASPIGWLAFQWSLLVTAANIVYNAAGYAGPIDWDLTLEDDYFGDPEVPAPADPEPAPTARRGRKASSDA